MNKNRKLKIGWQGGVLLLFCLLLVAFYFFFIQRASKPVMPVAQRQEMWAMMKEVGQHASLAYRAAVIKKMLEEANYFAERLKLPTKRPIQITDICSDWDAGAWFSIIHTSYPPHVGYFNYLPATIFTTNIYNASISRERRLQSLRFGLYGYLDITNFEFGFNEGRLVHIMRLDAPQTEYYARRLNELVGKPSLIDTNGAYQLATQWLAAVDIDVTALEKQSGLLIKGGHSVNQLHYLARGATNYITLPLYYVDFGSQHFPASGNLKAFDEPLVSVEILGTTKELQELTIGANTMGGNIPYDHRPLLLVTNALDLIRTSNPPVKQLQNPAVARAYALTPTQVSNYTKSFQSSSLLHTNIIQTNSLSPPAR
jgi:hypothetical protein